MATLAEQAHLFAVELTDSVRAVVGMDCAPFRSIGLVDDGKTTLSVRQNPDTGIPLQVEGTPLLTLTASYRCVWDHREQFLAVEDSQIKVYPGAQAQGEPLFRYEYERSPVGDIPGAHLQVHAHRDALTYVMTRSGTGSRRGKALSQRVRQGGDHPALHQLHFPLGGSRLRPCLEDVLQMLVSELGVDTQDGWRETLEAGRERWRRRQIGAAVRDSPASAVEVLGQLGYTITPPDPEPVERGHRMRDL